MDRAPFSAFLLLLIGVVLLAQFVTGNIWTFLDGLLGTSTAAPSTGSTGATGARTSAKAPAYAGNARQA
jgi:hypothetical protein